MGYKSKNKQKDPTPLDADLKKAQYKQAKQQNKRSKKPTAPRRANGNGNTNGNRKRKAQDEGEDDSVVSRKKGKPVKPVAAKSDSKKQKVQEGKDAAAANGKKVVSQMWDNVDEGEDEDDEADQDLDMEIGEGEDDGFLTSDNGEDLGYGKTQIGFGGSDDEEEEDGADEDSDGGGEDGDEDDDEFRTLDEKRSRKIEARKRREAEMGDAELADSTLQTNIAEVEKFKLPSGQEIEREQLAPDLQIVHTRIQEITNVLNNFKTLRDPERSRADYVDVLVKDLAHYYGYNEYIMEKLFHLFPVSEAIEFFEANEVPRPVTVRTNTLRTRRRDLAQALINRGVNLEPIGKWSK
ncbi:hypothetical protein BC938DRAFT_478789, partial [Jimgerdemannia flammicorona]